MEDDEEREAPPRNRRQRLVRFLCRVIERCYGDDALASVALSRAVDAVASLIAPRQPLTKPPRAPELLKGSDEQEEDAWALPSIETMTMGQGEPPHSPNAREAGLLVDEVLAKLKSAKAAHSMRGAQVPRDRGKGPAMAASEASSSTGTRSRWLGCASSRCCGGDAHEGQRIGLGPGTSALQDLEKAWDYGDEDSLLELDTYADSARVLASVVAFHPGDGPFPIIEDEPE